MSLKLGFARVPSKLPKSSLTKFYRFNIHPFISLRKEELLDILWLDKKSLISCVLCTSIKVRALLLTEKIPYEY